MTVLDSISVSPNFTPIENRTCEYIRGKKNWFLFMGFSSRERDERFRVDHPRGGPEGLHFGPSKVVASPKEKRGTFFFLHCLHPFVCYSSAVNVMIQLSIRSRRVDYLSHLKAVTLQGGQKSLYMGPGAFQLGPESC